MIKYSFLLITATTVVLFSHGLASPVRNTVSIDNDFESGSTGSWNDESPSYVNWRVESYDKPSETNNSVPRPTSGTKYLRATRTADLQSGLAVLRSVAFVANPGDEVSFDFWIRSRRPEGNNLELAWLVGRNETLLAGLSSYSTLGNFEWRTYTVSIPVDSPTEGTLYFYGYCGSYDEDAIAIDNIRLFNPSVQTTAGPTTPGGSETSDYCTVFSDVLEGTFASPNFPNDYPNNANECWIITDVYGVLRLKALSFVTEPSYDVLTFYTGFNSTENRINSWSGSLSAGTSSDLSASYYNTNSFTFIFKSDSTTTYQGFRLYFLIDNGSSSTTLNDLQQN